MAKTTKPRKKISDLLLTNVKTLAEGITSEKLSAMFFDATKLKYQPEPLYRAVIPDPDPNWREKNVL